MGLTASSTGSNASKTELIIKKKNEKDKIIAVAGNPNVGKSTLFNALTGMHQHTGNWPGKTVSNAQGYFETEKNSYVLVDIPGTYSLLAHSPEEEVARNFICFDNPDAVIVVCDATCLERNLNLVLQILETDKKVIVCVNLLDEAKRKGIEIKLDLLSQKLGVAVIGTIARNKKTLRAVMNALDEISPDSTARKVRYPDIIEQAVQMIEPEAKRIFGENRLSRWLSIQLLEPDETLLKEIKTQFGEEIITDKKLNEAIEKAHIFLYREGVKKGRIKDMITSAIITDAEEIFKETVTINHNKYNYTDRKIDKVLTNKFTGYLVMILLLALIFWITITGANYISEILSLFFNKLEKALLNLLTKIHTPLPLKLLITEGVFRVPAWVISVMLPPMAIFFPLFTLLEDIGYLPRIAFNLDKPFKRCHGCGKQALTMCMGIFMVFLHPR